jgi:hypothetical protein
MKAVYRSPATAVALALGAGALNRQLEPTAIIQGRTTP